VTIQFFQDRLGFEPVHHLVKVIRNHYPILKEFIPKNISVKLIDNDFNISSLMYSAYNQLFKEIIKRECRDTKKMNLKIDLNYYIFSIIDEFICQGTTQRLTQMKKLDVVQVLKFAQKWEIEELSLICQHILKAFLSAESAVPMLLEAHLNGWSKLKEECCQFINHFRWGVQLSAPAGDQLACEFTEFTDNGLDLFDKIKAYITRLVCRRKVSEEAAFAKIVKSCPRLDCLDLSLSYSLPPAFKEVPKMLPELDLSSCAWLNEESLKSICQSCQNLKSLVLTSNTQLSFEVWGTFRKLIHLRYLILDRCNQIGDEEIKLILQACPGLNTLSLDECRHITDAGFILIPRYAARIVSLNLSRCGISDEGLIEMISHMINLTQLNLTRCDHLTERGIQEAVRLASSLREVNLTKCNIPPKMVSEIRSKRPSLKIIFD
jgi:hypothetical protein